ncbi:acyl-CoA dehydrogenase [Pseudomonas sp. S31]|nr:acyl-CoA dehydrogenase [Pseudomonas sp. S31]
MSTNRMGWLSPRLPIHGGIGNNQSSKVAHMDINIS